ncbi:hypothetical protein HDU84_007151 [Entophlyctis sp. JEL0112]|nr:hypothetical protein HDU84_007151 [Entophlyctis sp. JEL0112]
MSGSNQHLPPSVKRSASSISNSADAVFPAQPGLSYEDVAVFAQQVQQALNQTLLPASVSAKRPKVETLDADGEIATLLDNPDLSFVSLPLVSPHKLNYRFKVAPDNSVFVIARKSYLLLKKALLDLNTDDYAGIYLRGPIGVGKSYLLYVLAAELRFLRKTHRVTYINDCQAWRDDKFGFILRELVMTFFDEGEIGGKTIIQWCDAVAGSDEEEMMMRMMLELIRHVKKKGLEWVIICDQHNALYAHSVVVQQFPFSIINYLSNNCDWNIKIIISASANNEGHPTEMRGVPYELSLLWQQLPASLIDKTEEYRKNRTNEMWAAHGRFCRKLDSAEKRNLEECTVRMALGLTRPDGLVGLDWQLFDIIRQPKEGHPDKFDEFIVAFNPVARRSLMDYHGQDLLTSPCLVTELVLYGSCTQDEGRIAEKYLVSTMELLKKFSFQYAKKTVGGLSTGIPTRKSIDLVEFIHFSGQNLPPSSSFNRKCSTLFVPESVAYPGYGFFIWDSKSSELLAFQVSVVKPFYEHPKFDSTAASENCQNWSVFCDAKAVHVYWVIPEGCIGGSKTKKAVGNNVVLFESLWKDYPSLERLAIRKQLSE